MVPFFLATFVQYDREFLLFTNIYFLLACLEVSAAIKCYGCASTIDTNCRDKVASGTLIIDCPPAVTTCQTAKGEINGKTEGM